MQAFGVTYVNIGIKNYVNALCMNCHKWHVSNVWFLADSCCKNVQSYDINC